MNQVSECSLRNGVLPSTRPPCVSYVVKNCNGRASRPCAWQHFKIKMDSLWRQDAKPP
jgi:hypothetical protein